MGDRAAAVILGERPPAEFGVLVLPAVVGTYLLSFGWMAPGDALTGSQAKPALYALGAAALWGAATAFGRRGLREVEPNTLMALRFSLALPFLAVIAARGRAAARAAPARATGCGCCCSRWAPVCWR